MLAATFGAGALAFTSLRWQIAAAVAVAVLMVVAAPTLVVPLLAVTVVGAMRRRYRRRRHAAEQRVADLASMCELTAIALTGGLALQEAIEVAAEHVGGELAKEVHQVLRKSRVDGMAAAMAGATGAGSSLYRLIGRAAVTGAPLVDSVGRLADEMHADLVAARLERARRLPVLMLFPLTMLILPGFLLLAVAPAVVDAFARLEL